MSATNETTGGEASGREGGLRRFLGLYTSPSESFLPLARRGRFWIPILALVVLNLAFTAAWLSRVDAPEFFKAQLQEAGQWDRFAPAQREQVLATQARFLPLIAWGAALLGPPLVVLWVGFLFWVIFRFALGDEVNFRPAASVVAYAYLATALVQLPLILLVLALKGDWSLNPQSALQANLTLLLTRESVAKPLWVLAESIDLFVAWLLWLRYKGFRVTTRQRPFAVAAAVLGIEVLVVAAKMAWAAVF